MGLDRGRKWGSRRMQGQGLGCVKLGGQGCKGCTWAQERTEYAPATGIRKKDPDHWVAPALRVSASLDSASPGPS